MNKDDSDVEGSKIMFETGLAAAPDPSPLHTPLGINHERFSSTLKLIRVTAYAMRFVNKMQKLSTESDSLTVEELSQAKLSWELLCPRKGFP